MNIQELGVSGYYTLEKLNEKDEVVYSTSFKNLITDMGFNAFLTRDIELHTMALYTDTGAVNPTMSTIGAPVIYTSNVKESETNGVNTDGDVYLYNRRTFLFNQGVVNGNVNRIAMLFDSATVFSVTTIKDHLGVDTVIQLDPTERLRITYEFRVYQPKQETVVFPNVDMGDEGLVDITVRTALTNAIFIARGLFKAKKMSSIYTGMNGSETLIHWTDGEMVAERLTPITKASVALSGSNHSAVFGRYKEKECMEFTAVINPTDASDTNIRTIVVNTLMGGFQIGYSKPIIRNNGIRKTVTVKLYIAVARV